MALGTGAGTSAWSALHALLLQPLPYPGADRLVSLYETTVDRKPRDVAEANLMDWQKRATLFEAMGAFRSRSFGFTLTNQDAVTVTQTGMVTAGFFPALGVAPRLGRAFTSAEEAADSRLLILTDRLWREQFAAAEGALGRTVFLNEDPYTVIGVMPRGFEYPMDLVLPAAFLPLSRRDYCCSRLGSLAAIGRLKPRATLTAARSELEAVAAQLSAEFPASNGGRSAGLRPLAETLTGSRREPLLLLTAAAALLLLIACANVAGLMLARALSRSREMAVRASLGAGKWRMARPFLAESLALALAGGGGGLLAAQAVLRFVPRFIPGADDAGLLRLDGSAFAFALGFCALLAALLACAPLAVARRANLNGAIKAGRGYRRAALVVAQAALSVVLLLSAGLLLRSFYHLLATNPGFATAHALRFGIGLPEKPYDTELRMIEFHHQLLDRLQAISGVASVGAAARSPLRGGAPGGSGTFQIAGAGIPAAQRPQAWVNVASPGYFLAMGVPLLAGREFSWRDDRPETKRAAVVNQAFARAYLRDRPALGTLLEIRWVSELNPPGSTWQVVGVAGDTPQTSLGADVLPEIFISMTQVGCDGAGYVIRAPREDAGMPKAIAAAVARQDPRIQRVAVTRMSALVERSLGSRAAAIELVGAFAALALLLTAVGVYGMAAFRAVERSREMAIRMALGASAGHVRNLILGHAARLGAAGVALGLCGFFFAAPLIGNQLYGVRALDPLTIVAVAGCVWAVALAASLVPGRRATRHTPISLLRDS